ncbi:condensation domain-containing protein, partial [Paenactinomyces guangxiensis]
LRQYLAKSLPDYMIPASFVELEKLPLTPNGKVDKKALPEPSGRMQTGAEYVAPTNPIEEMLVRVWQEVLGIEQVGIHDNFFRLGGDSIKAIQIVSQLNRQNQKLEMKHLFQNPTVSELAPYIESYQTMAAQGVVKGEVELTPVQRWFFEQHFADPHHWNQSMMLYNRKGWDPKAVEQVFRKLTEHHDVLRMTYYVNGEKVIQTNRGLDGKFFELHVCDLTRDTDVMIQIEREANRLQRKNNLSHGPLVQLGLFQTADGDHLLIIIHHLVVDGVSWRILLEDFATGYQQAIRQEVIDLPAKTHSYQIWSQKLWEYANSKKFLQELTYWKEIDKMKVPPLPGDQGEMDRYLIKDSEVVNISLTEEKTNQLLTSVHRAYHTDINDLLLAALAFTIKEWTNEDKVAVSLEGHGREEIIEGIDITRTVGWFTSIYPVVFDLKTNDLSYTIKSVKETLREIPNKGVGYGILKYLTSQENKDFMTFNLRPEISFNYLGQFDQDVRTEAFSLSSLPMGEQMSPRSQDLYKLDVIGIVESGKLQFVFRYNQKIYNYQHIEGLAERFKDHLLRIVFHCMEQEEEERTPSDFTAHEELTLEELEDVFGVLEEMEK